MTKRIFATGRIWALSPEAFDRAVELLAGSERSHQPEWVIGIDRGGREPALALGQRLNIPVTMIRARHNNGDQVRTQATGVVTVDPIPLLNVPPGRRVLLVDDICGSSATLRTVTIAVTAMLTPSMLRTVTLCRNSGAKFSPDAWVWEVADWVHFPWEPPPAAVTEPLPAPESVRHP